MHVGCPRLKVHPFGNGLIPNDDPVLALVKIVLYILFEGFFVVFAANRVVRAVFMVPIMEPLMMAICPLGIPALTSSDLMS